MNSEFETGNESGLPLKKPVDTCSLISSVSLTSWCSYPRKSRFPVDRCDRFTPNGTLYFEPHSRWTTLFIILYSVFPDPTSSSWDFLSMHIWSSRILRDYMIYFKVSFVYQLLCRKHCVLSRWLNVLTLCGIMDTEISWTNFSPGSTNLTVG